MDLELREVQESVAAVLDEECPSLAVHGYIDGRDALDTRLQQLAGELGWLAIALPEEHGGLGLGAAGLAILNYELGRAAAPGAFLATSVVLQAIALSDAAREPAVETIIADAVGGKATLALAAKLEAPKGDAPVWLLGEADAAAALMAGEGDDLFLVDLAGAATDKVTMWDETRSMIALAPSAGKRIAKLTGARPMLEAFYALALAADSAGIARGVLDRTVVYMKEREQFGRPIGSFQALKHRAADHQVNAIAALQLVWQAVDQLDANAAGARMWPAMAKANVTEAAARIAGDCVQLHGGVGFTREYDPHLYMKRGRLNEMLLADNPQLRDRAELAFGAALRDGHDVLEIA